MARGFMDFGGLIVRINPTFESIAILNQTFMKLKPGNALAEIGLTDFQIVKQTKISGLVEQRAGILPASTGFVSLPCSHSFL